MRALVRIMNFCAQHKMIIMQVYILTFRLEWHNSNRILGAAIGEHWHG